MTPTQREAVILALKAADIAAQGQIGIVEAANMVGSGLTSAVSANFILRRGSPEEIAAVRDGSASIKTTAKAIKARLGVMKSERPITIRSQESIRKYRFEAQVWSDLSQGIMALSALPNVDEVLKIVKSNSQRQKAVDSKLLIALSWISEFADAWTKK